MNKKIDLVASIAAGMKPPSAQGSLGGSKADGERPARSSSRAGKSFIGGYFPPEVAKQMKMLAAEQETTIQLLTAEALNHLFAAYGKPQIAHAME